MNEDRSLGLRSSISCRRTAIAIACAVAAEPHRNAHIGHRLIFAQPLIRD